MIRSDSDAPDRKGVGLSVHFTSGASSDVIGQIRSLVGSVTVIRGDGAIVQAAAGDMLVRGDIIETGAHGRVGITFTDGTLFNLSSRARMGLEEFVCNPDGVPSSALFNLTQGTFAFVVGRLAKNGSLRVNTPFGTIRGDAQGGLIGVLTLVALTLILLQDVGASPNSDLAFVLDDIIDYKDLQHGTFEIVTKEVVPRVITVDDPEVSVVIRQSPAGFNIQQITNTSADMAALMAASHDANAAYRAGLADPFTTGSVGGRASLGSGFFDGSVGTLNSFVRTASSGPNDGVSEKSTLFDEPWQPTTPKLLSASTALALVGDEGLLAVGSNEATFAGTLNFTFGIGGAGSINFASMDGVVGVVGQESIIYSWDGSTNTLTATVNAGARAGLTLFTIDLDPHTGSFTATLLANVLHPPGANEVIPSATLIFTVTDGLGTSTTSTLIVSFRDAAPTAIDDAGRIAVEDAAGSIGGNVLTNDLQGADGAVLTHVRLPGGSFVSITDGSEGPPGVFSFVVPAIGTYTFQASGAWTFDPVNNQVSPVDASFAYQITDGDGDTDEAVQPITVVDGLDATSSGTAVLSVEESDLGTGSTPTGVDETATSTGLSFKSGSDAITLSFAAIQSPSVSGLDNLATLTWIFDPADPSGRTLLGQIGAVSVIKLTLTGDVTATGGGDVATPTVTAVLLDNFPHENAPDFDSLTISGLVVNATDTDGEITTGTVNVTVVDDAPDIEIAGANSIAEGGTLNGSWTLNDGADDVASIKVSVTGQADQFVTLLPGGTSAVFLLTAGTLTVNANGTWSFAANINLDSTPEPTVSFTVAATDGDGDGDSDSHTITVVDALDATSSGTAVLSVEESDLGTGSTPTGVDETATSTGLSFKSGSDAITLSFAAIQSPSVSGLDNLATLTWIFDPADPSGRTLLGQIGAVSVIKLTLTGDVTATGGGDVATPTVTAVLLDNFPHENAPDFDSLTISGLVVNATDTDGEITTGTVNVTVVDDAPDIEIAGANSIAEGGTLNGSWTLNDGADDVASIKVSVTGQADQFVTLLPGGTSAVFLLTAGTLTVNANGTWSFAANINLDSTPEPTVSFTVAATDGDGDGDSDSHTITVVDALDATSSGTAVLSVEESDLGTGSTPTGVDETATSTGLSFKSGSDAITLSFAAIQSPSVSGLDNLATLTWIFDPADPSGRTLLGQIGAVSVIKLTLTGDVTATGGGDVATPTVTAVLLDNFPHENAPDFDSLTISGLVVNATDTDGEITTGTVNVTVVDDAPDIEIAGANSIAEGGTLNGSWTLNDGADDVASIKVSVTGQADQFVTLLPGGTSAVFLLTAGTLTVNANGTWSFAANINLDSTPEPTVSFTVAATDGDGDGDSDSHTITVVDALDATSSGTAVLSVEESDLGTGSTPTGVDETATSTGLSFKSGSDAITLSFAAIQSPSVSGLDNLATLTWIFDPADPSGRTLLGQIGAVSVIKLTLTGDVTATGGGDVATPTVTAVLLDNFPHENAPDFDSLTISGLVVNATDTDGEITTGTVNVTVVDDAPSAVSDTQTVGEAGTVTGNILLGTTDPGDEDVFGADEAGAIKIVALSDGDSNPGDDYLLNGSANQPDANNIVLMNGLYGLLQLNVVTGDYTYIETVPTTADQTEVFSYTIRDADGDLSTATLTVAIDDTPASVLDGVLKTNSNVQSQLITLSFVESASTDFRDSLHAAAKIYDLFLQGQQGSIIQDVGFTINETAHYNVTLEASSGTKAIITEFSLEEVLIQDAGNVALEINNTSGTSADSTAIVAVMDPGDPPPVQPKTESVDGDQSNNSLSDTATNTVNYYFGASGADVLTGSSDDDVLNGGAGRDTLNGEAGNDMLVYDAANNDIINGGSNSLDSATNDGFNQEDWDILRVDNGALALSQAGSGLDANTLGPANNVLVDLAERAIMNIEMILITEEAGTSTLGVDPNDDVGTTLSITADDIFHYTDADHELWILGSPGDVVQLDSGGGWIDADPNTDGTQGTAWTGTGGQMFTVYQSTNGALVYMENEVKTQFIP